MPIWLRNFTFTQIKTYIEKQNEQYKVAPIGNSKPLSPDIQPSYSAKASNK